MREYAEAVAKIINENYEGYSAEIMEVVKINDELNVGVRVREGESKVAPVHYINPYTECGISAEECAKDIMAMKPEAENIKFNCEEELTWDAVRGNIAMRLVNLEYNKEFLADKVYRDLGNGLAMMFDVDKGDCRIAVTKSLAETLGCDDVALVVASQMSKVGKPVLYDMAEKLFADEPTNFLEGDKTSHSSMLVLTAMDVEYGASMLYKGSTGAKIEEVVGDYYLLPSSVHEWIVVPTFSGIPVEELEKMVKEANETVVERRDLLSYGVYKFENGRLKRIA